MCGETGVGKTARKRGTEKFRNGNKRSNQFNLYGEGCIRKILDCNQADRFLNLFIHAKPIGGDLVQVLGDGVGALAPKFFLLSPKMRNLGGDSLYLRNKCWLSIIMYWRCIYYHIFYHLTPDLCLLLVGSAVAKYRNQPHKYRTQSTN